MLTPTRWVTGLQQLCKTDAQAAEIAAEIEAGAAGAGPSWAEHVHLLASAAAMHKDW